MNRKPTFLAALLLAAWCLVASGCITGNSGQSSIPWSRPAEWENQVPGMGGAMNGGG